MQPDANARYALDAIFGLPLKTALGLASIVFSPFSMAYALFSVVAYRLILVVVHERRDARAVVGGGSFLLWATHFLSTRTLVFVEGAGPNGDPMASAGFPLLAFLYPFPPLGGDVPPFGQWIPFFLNYGFWLALSLLLVPRLIRAFRKPDSAARIILLAGTLVALYGLGDTVLRFD